MIKNFIKSTLARIFGEATLEFYILRLKGQPIRFSEARLIESFFEKESKVGVMVDVGAHFGESFKSFQRWGWKVHAFEPDPNNRSKLIDSSNLTNVTLYDVAVSNREEESVAFFSSSESDGISSLSAFRETHKESNRVRLTTLAKILKEQGETQVDYLKIDAEGHDLFVLQGFPWSQFKPTVVMCEFEDRKTKDLGYTFRDLADLLTSNGYQVFVSEWAPIVRYGGNHKWCSWSRYPCPLNNTNGWGNIVGFKNGVSFGVVDRMVQTYRNRKAS